jgi:transposase
LLSYPGKQVQDPNPISKDWCCPLLTRDELIAIGRKDLESLVDYILLLQQQVESLQQQVKTLQQKVASLEAQSQQNSRNSNKPPSTDGFKKPAPKSLRKNGERKPGGQPGHSGHTLKRVANPDHIHIIPLDQCVCGKDLSQIPATDHESRQVFDLPKPRLEVTDHRAEIKCCPDCGQTVRAAFPPGVTAPAQYGLRFQSLLLYWHHQQLLPTERITQMCLDLYGQSISEATIFQVTELGYQQLESFEAIVIEQLQSSSCAHADESGMRVQGKLHWLHSCSTPEVTHYFVHSKRGLEAMQAGGILPVFKGRLIHDFWKPYFRLECEHGLCNPHLLRELQALSELGQQPWTSDLSQLLLDMNEFSKTQKVVPAPQDLDPWLKNYEAILQAGWKLNPILPSSNPSKRGRPKHSKAQNLLERFQTHRDSILAFLFDPTVPFSNNLAEQDIRMLKVQQKISGCFRTFKGAQYFCRIRSYLSTARKQSRNIFNAIVSALSGQPFIPSPSLRT